MSRRSQFFWMICLTLLSLNIGYFAGQQIRFKRPNMKILRSEKNKINEVLDVVSTNYVDSVDISFLAESAVEKIISELDPHSSYIPASLAETANEELEVSFSGIGITFQMFTDTVLVTNVTSGGPAERAGLMAFDKIITVDDSIIAGKKIHQNRIIRILRGTKDSKVMLGVQRRNEAELISFELVRGDIPNPSIDVAYKVTDNIGYIKVAKFARSTYTDFLTKIAKLKEEGATGFIIDLRDNPGGYMESAIYMINEFLPRGNMIVYTQGRVYPRTDTRANGKGACLDAPLVLLIDELSGSASEIFSGAIQDNDRGLIIGRRSYGKGLVQTKLELSDQSELLLTIARYYTPSGRCIQKDYELGKAEEYSMDVENRFYHGEFYTADSIKQNEELAYQTTGGRTVFGGGGIMPDIFIPRDTTGYTTYYLNLHSSQRVLYQFTMDYSVTHQEKLKSFSDYRALQAYLKTLPLVDELADFAAAKGIPRRPSLMQISKSLIEKDIQAYIVRNFFDNDGFYPIFQQDDPTLNKAIYVINNNLWKPDIYSQFVEEKKDTNPFGSVSMTVGNAFKILTANTAS